MVDRLERLTNLVLLLREEHPRSLREIADSVPGYPREGEARRQAFERDKRTLRGGGVEVTPVAVDGPDQIGYVIREEDFYLPPLDLEADEQTALNLAVAGVHLGDPSGRDALWRLGLPATAGVQPLAELPALPSLPKLHGALRSHATVSFSYRGHKRRVDPALLRFRGGWWYLVGFDLDKSAARTFRVDRMEGLPSVGQSGSANLPKDFELDRAVTDEPWKMGEADPVSVDVLVEAPLAAFVVSEVGEPRLAETRDDGSIVVRLDVTNISALRSWVLELGDRAVVLSPESVRQEVIDWLKAIVSAPPPKKPRRRVPNVEALATTPGKQRKKESAQGGLRDGRHASITSGRVEAGVRLHRLLAVLTWLARSGRSPVSELAERFGISPTELIADLELAACCGLPPYTPDQLMEIMVDEEEVVADLGPELTRPRRLTPAEGFALAASARAILAVPGADPGGALASALEKLEAVLGDRGSLRVDLDEPPHLAEVRRAALDHEQVELRYYSVSSDSESLRIVDPVDVVTVDGRWYLDGYCHKAEGMRRFRVDRISEVRSPAKRIRPTLKDADHRSSPGPSVATAAFVPGPDADLAHLSIDDDASWVMETVPVLDVRALAKGRTEVVLGVSSTVWFERLLLRLGHHAEVLGPPQLADVGRNAARTLLHRYGHDV